MLLAATATVKHINGENMQIKKKEKKFRVEKQLPTVSDDDADESGE